jgi:hypothetical protein
MIIRLVLWRRSVVVPQNKVLFRMCLRKGLNMEVTQTAVPTIHLIKMEQRVDSNVKG